MPKPPAKKSKVTNVPDASNSRMHLERRPKSGQLKKVLRDERLYLEWSDDAFPTETPREAWERSEYLRVRAFLKKHADPDHNRPWPIPGLHAVIKSDNGRLRLWLEIREDTGKQAILDQFDNLSAWKTLLVDFDGKRDPLPHPIGVIMQQLEVEKKTAGQVAKSLNEWIVERMYDWVRTPAHRLQIQYDVGGLLKLLLKNDPEDPTVRADPDKIMRNAIREIREGHKPFLPGKDNPISADLIKSRRRTWKKRV